LILKPDWGCPFDPASGLESFGGKWAPGAVKEGKEPTRRATFWRRESGKTVEKLGTKIIEERDIRLVAARRARS